MSCELKLKELTASEIASVTGGKLEIFGANPDNKQKFISTDSREAGRGVIFCAIKGEHADGHDYINSAAAEGSDCIICEKIPDGGCSAPYCAVVVDDTVNAMGKLAAYYRGFTKAKVVAVTGSVGKTTTKEFIAAVASAKYKTYKTSGNYNNLLGLPLTVFGISPDDEVIVLEMGMSARGEIEYLTKIARPDIAVITNIGTAHLASLGTRENICQAKLEIRHGLGADGILLINADEPLLIEATEHFEKKPAYMSIYNRNGDFRAVNIRQKPDKIIYDLIYDSKAVTNVEIPTIGRHNVYNSLAAYAVGTMLGMSDDSIRAGLLRFVGVDRRQKIYEIEGITVIDDCYNASPESMRAAIDVLVSIAAKKGARPCALLGDMLELGEDSRLLHDQIGQYAAQAQIQKLFCFGPTADVVAEAAIKKGIRAENVCVSLDTTRPDIMGDMILDTLSPGDILLVKASRGIAAERVIDYLSKKKRKKTK